MAEPIITIAAWRGIEDHLRLFNDDRDEFLKLLRHGRIPYEDLVLALLGFERLERTSRAMLKHNVSLLNLDDKSRQLTLNSLQASGLGFTLFSPRLKRGLDLDSLVQNYAFSSEGSTWWVTILVDLAEAFPKVELEVALRPELDTTSKLRLDDLVAELLCYIAFTTTDHVLFSEIATVCMERYAQITRLAEVVLGDATENWNLEHGAAGRLKEEIAERRLVVKESLWLSGVKEKVNRVRCYRSSPDAQGETAMPNLGSPEGWVRHT